MAAVHVLGPQVSPLEQVLVAVDDQLTPACFPRCCHCPSLPPSPFRRRFAGGSPAESQLVMSERTRDLPRRSCLSVPGSSEKMLGKGPTIPADMTFLDLEDAVAPLEKEAARAKVVDAIKNLDWGERVLCVRVNAWDTKWTAYDVIEVVGNAGERLDEIMLPEGAVGRRGRRPRPAAHPGREERRPARRPHRHRGADRDGARPHQRRGDLRGVAAARDDHPRPRRHVGVDGDAVARRRPADPRVPGRLLPLRVREDPHGRAGPTACR